MNAYNNTKHSTTGFAPNDIKKEDIDTVKNNIKKRGRVKKYEDINEGDSVRLQLKEKTFRKESDPTSLTPLLRLWDLRRHVAHHDQYASQDSGRSTDPPPRRYTPRAGPASTMTAEHGPRPPSTPALAQNCTK